VYYSGHGALQNTTGICTIENTFYPLEEKLRSAASRTNTYFIVLFDSCRVVQYKYGTEKPNIKTPGGQMYFLFAASPGRTATGNVGSISPVTQSFINHLKSAQLPWPQCLDNWVGTKAELTSVLTSKKTIYLTASMVKNPNTLTGSTPSNPFDDWTPTQLASWFKTLKLSKDYSDIIVSKGIDGSGLRVIEKESLWTEYNIELAMDQTKIKVALKKMN